MTDLLRARLARREWTVTVETVTPSPADRATCARILELADAMRDDGRMAALTLTDRTRDHEADPVRLAPEVTARSGKQALVHLAGKARTPHDVERTLRVAREAGVADVLLTGGDVAPGAGRVDAVDMLALARQVAPSLLRVAVLAVPSARRLDEARDHAGTKCDAGAEAFVSQVSWDLAQREAIAGWQATLSRPVLGATVMLTGHTLRFLDAHAFTGMVVPRALRDRAATEDVGAAVRRLALDVVLLRRLRYAGVHLSGVVTPRLVTAVLDEADRLHRTLGDDWRDVWRDAMGLA